MSETPRTDKNEQHVYVVRGDYGLVSSSFSRDLERELNAAKARIARLEEAGDRLAAFTPPSSDRFGAWRKAKEPKP